MSVGELLYGRVKKMVNNTMEIEIISLGHYLLKIKEIDMEENKVTETQIQLDFNDLADIYQLIDKLLTNEVKAEVFGAEEVFKHYKGKVFKVTTTKEQRRSN